MTVQPNGTEVEGQEPQTEATAEATTTEAPPETAAPETPAEEIFYDATLVPDHLRPSYQKMQAAYTQKTQEIAPWRKLQKYGSADEVAEFLEELQTEEGAHRLFLDMAEQLGISREQLAALVTGQESTETPTPPARQTPTQTEPDPDKPLTWADYQRIQEEAAEKQRYERDQAEIDAAIKELQVPDEALRAVYGFAAKYPQSLGQRERIKRGWEDFNKFLDSRVAATQEERQRKLDQTPADLGGGGAPNSQSEPPADLAEAKRRALAFMNRERGS